MRLSDAFVWIVLLVAPIAATIRQWQPLGAEDMMQTEPLSQQRGDASSSGDNNGNSVHPTIKDRSRYADEPGIDLATKAASKIAIRAERVAPVKVEARPSSQPANELNEPVKSIAASSVVQ